MVPPVAAADLPPAVGVGPDVLEQHDVHQEEDEARAQADAGSARDPLDGAGARPDARQEGDRGEAAEQDQPEQNGLDRGGEVAAHDREQQDDDGLQQAQQNRAPDDSRHVRHVVAAA
jgi:hypothetical protein